jgi:hypothetical protein
MSDTNAAPPAAEPWRTLTQFAKQAGLFILFGTILSIPRLRRLRRRVWPWTCVRLVSALCGFWLAWRFTRGQTGWASLLAAGILLAFSLLVRSRPLAKSVDALAHELSALVVLNGGAFRLSGGARVIPSTQIYVRPDALIVTGSHEQRLAEIPLTRVQNLTAYAIDKGSGKGAEPWEVRIEWLSGEACTASFRYEGAFAEHLARVTESTVLSQWKKELPVIP